MISVKCEKERKIWTHLKYSQFFIKPRSKTCTKRKKYGRSGLSVIWKVVGINFSNEQLFGRKISRVKVLRIKHGAERIFSGVKIPTVQYGILNLLFHLNDTHKGGIKVCQEFVELVLTESIELINVGSVVFVFLSLHLDKSTQILRFILLENGFLFAAEIPAGNYRFATFGWFIDLMG